MHQANIKIVEIDETLMLKLGMMLKMGIFGKYLFNRRQTSNKTHETEIYNIINDLKKNGIVVMFVSSELPEVLGMSDRVIVMCNGKITGELVTKDTNQEEILQYATQY